jgi:hypothetical protein
MDEKNTSKLRMNGIFMNEQKEKKEEEAWQ